MVKLGNFGLVRDLVIGGLHWCRASTYITYDVRKHVLYTAPEQIPLVTGDSQAKPSVEAEKAADIWFIYQTVKGSRSSDGSLQSRLAKWMRLSSSNVPNGFAGQQSFNDDRSYSDHSKRSRRTTSSNSSRYKELQNLLAFLKYGCFRSYYFSYCFLVHFAYVTSFLLLGILMLSILFLIAFGVIALGRWAVSELCECDVSAPQHLIISGIFLILLFALLFTCFNVAVGEYKHRLSKGSFTKSCCYIERPEEDVEFYGCTVIRAKPPRCPTPRTHRGPHRQSSRSTDDAEDSVGSEKSGGRLSTIASSTDLPRIIVNHFYDDRPSFNGNSNDEASVDETTRL
ncbi:FLR-4 protein [Aphelenchoides avenae]|nr:FLR-4 protein [Aphelenchus avenae]